MKNWRELLGNERGTALALAMIILVIMTALAIGLATMGGVEARISASQSASTRARLLAESGIEYGLLKLSGGVGGGDFSSKLAAGTSLGSNERSLIPAGTTLPGLLVRVRHVRGQHPERHQYRRQPLDRGGIRLRDVRAQRGGQRRPRTPNGVIILTSTRHRRRRHAHDHRGGAARRAATSTRRSRCRASRPTRPRTARARTRRARRIRCATTRSTGATGARPTPTSPTGTATLKLGIATATSPAAWRRTWRARSTTTYKRALRAGTQRDESTGDAHDRAQHDQRRQHTDDRAHPEVHGESRREPRDADHHEHAGLPVRAPAATHDKPEGLRMASTAHARASSRSRTTAAGSGRDQPDHQPRQPHVDPR